MFSTIPSGWAEGWIRSASEADELLDRVVARGGVVEGDAQDRGGALADGQNGVAGGQRRDEPGRQRAGIEQQRGAGAVGAVAVLERAGGVDRRHIVAGGAVGR